MNPRLLLVLLFASLAACREAPRLGSESPVSAGQGASQGGWQPELYACLRTSRPILVDGQLTDEEWGSAPYTSDFIDIEGAAKPLPRFRTRARLLWDEEMLYVAVEMEDPHLWGSLVERDSVVWHENDFEIFLDPDGDNHHYFELEVSPRGTVFDLFLIRPYRDGHAALHEWDIPGLEVGIHLDGTLNQPNDIDRGWTLELGIPWGPLMANRPLRVPEVGERWRMNLTRVAWRHRVESGRYVKVTEPRVDTGRPEDNWVWSSQGEVAMHLPEMWGILELRGDEQLSPTSPPLELNSRERAGWALMNVYYAQTAFRKKHGRFSADWTELDVPVRPPADWSWPPSLTAGARQFEALSRGPSSFLTVDHVGRLVELARAADGDPERRD